jgi:hypothetical protein
MFDAVRPDVFTVESRGRKVHVVANVIDPLWSDINRSRFATASAPAASTSRMPRLAFEPWVALLLVAVAMLAFEWLTYTRRITV